MERQANRIVAEALAGKPCPVDRVLAFLDPLLGCTPSIVELRHPRSRSRQVGDDEADARVAQKVVRVTDGIDRWFTGDPLVAQPAIRATVFCDLSSDSGGLSAKLQQRQLVRRWRIEAGPRTHTGKKTIRN